MDHHQDFQLDNRLWSQGLYGWVHPDKPDHFWHGTEMRWYVIADYERNLHRAQLEAQRTMRVRVLLSKSSLYFIFTLIGSVCWKWRTVFARWE